MQKLLKFVLILLVGCLITSCHQQDEKESADRQKWLLSKYEQNTRAILKNFELNNFFMKKIYDENVKSFYYLYEFDREALRCEASESCSSLLKLPSYLNLMNSRAAYESEIEHFKKIYTNLLDLSTLNSKNQKFYFNNNKDYIQLNIDEKKLIVEQSRSLIMLIDKYFLTFVDFNQVDDTSQLYMRHTALELLKVSQLQYNLWSNKTDKGYKDVYETLVSDQYINNKLKQLFSDVDNKFIIHYKANKSKYIESARSIFERTEFYKTLKNLNPTPLNSDFVEFTGHKFKHNQWALTFDDGPHIKYTTKILNSLELNKMHATFFWTAKNVFNSEGKKILRKAKDLGMSIANHSYTHANLNKKNSNYFKEIVSSQKVIEDALGGDDVNYFRLPYGNGRKKQVVQDYIKNAGMYHFFWTVDSLDWKDPDPESVLDRIVFQMNKQKGGIILLHDIQKVTPKVLDLLIKYFKKNDVDVRPLANIVKEFGYKGAHRKLKPKKEHD